MSRLALTLRIRGIVQGVGYRWSMVHEARRLGLAGWVRNRQDGSVEAVVAGTSEQVELLVTWAWQGPPGARVDAVEQAPAEDSLDGFEQRPTV